MGETTLKAIRLEKVIRSNLHRVNDEHECNFGCHANDELGDFKFLTWGEPPDQAYAGATRPQTRDGVPDEVVALVAELSRTSPKLGKYIDLVRGWESFIALHLALDAQPPARPFWSCIICDACKNGRPTAIPLHEKGSHLESTKHVYQAYLHLAGRNHPNYQHPVRLEAAAPDYCESFCVNFLDFTERRACCLANQLTTSLTHLVQDPFTDGQRPLFSACILATAEMPSIQSRRAMIRKTYMFSQLTIMNIAAANLEEATRFGHEAQYPRKCDIRGARGAIMRTLDLYDPPIAPAPPPVLSPTDPAYRGLDPTSATYLLRELHINLSARLDPTSATNLLHELHTSLSAHRSHDEPPDAEDEEWIGYDDEVEITYSDVEP